MEKDENRHTIIENATLTGGDARQHIEVVSFDAVVKARPQPGKKQFERTHGAIRIVGSNLERKAACALLCVLRLDIVLCGFLGDRSPYRRRGE